MINIICKNKYNSDMNMSGVCVISFEPEFLADSENQTIYEKYTEDEIAQRIQRIIPEFGPIEFNMLTSLDIENKDLRNKIREILK